MRPAPRRRAAAPVSGFTFQVHNLEPEFEEEELVVPRPVITGPKSARTRVREVILDRYPDVDAEWLIDLVRKGMTPD